MLAWLFWHTRITDVPRDDYVSALRAFHRRIVAAGPAGLLGARTREYTAVPWLASEAEVFEDWYLVRDSAALDALDEAVLASFSSAAHEAVARLAANAVSGLYELRAGRPAPDADVRVWLSKPRGIAYGPFVADLFRAGTIWSRKLVLGPTPEFCVETDAEGARSLHGLATHALASRRIE
jgi:hypothetical protein